MEGLVWDSLGRAVLGLRRRSASPARVGESVSLYVLVTEPNEGDNPNWPRERTGASGRKTFT